MQNSARETFKKKRKRNRRRGFERLLQTADWFVGEVVLHGLPGSSFKKLLQIISCPTKRQMHLLALKTLLSFFFSPIIKPEEDISCSPTVLSDCPVGPLPSSKQSVNARFRGSGSKINVLLIICSLCAVENLPTHYSLFDSRSEVKGWRLFGVSLQRKQKPDREVDAWQARAVLCNSHIISYLWVQAKWHSAVQEASFGSFSGEESFSLEGRPLADCGVRR